MMQIGLKQIALFVGACLIAAAAVAQFRGGRRQREPVFERGNVPQWDLEPEFASDCFTFVRIKYRTDGREHSEYPAS